MNLLPDYLNLVDGYALKRPLQKILANRVCGGPFLGMKYLPTAVASSLWPKILGTYEQELHPFLEKIVFNRRSHFTFINVGAAEGYYAVGVALRNPNVSVVAFETDENARTLMGKIANMNRIKERLTILGKCSPDDLFYVLSSSIAPIIFMDVEGYEERLLDTASNPGLLHACIIVEIHEFLNPGVGEKVRSRFLHTHQIKTIPAVKRHTGDIENIFLRSLAFFWRLWRKNLLAEQRPSGMEWNLMIPISRYK